MKKVSFEGDTLDALRSFPENARRTLGYLLDAAQRGLPVHGATAVKPIGPGCWELRSNSDGRWYRVLYVVRGDTIHVIAAFQKKSNKISAATMDVARRRYRSVTR